MMIDDGVWLVMKFEREGYRTEIGLFQRPTSEDGDEVTPGGG